MRIVITESENSSSLYPSWVAEKLDYKNRILAQASGESPVDAVTRLVEFDRKWQPGNQMATVDEERLGNGQPLREL